MIINRKPAGKAKISVRGIGAVTLQNRFFGIFTIAMLAAVAAVVTIMLVGQYAALPVSAQSADQIQIGDQGEVIEHRGSGNDSDTTYCGFSGTVDVRFPSNVAADDVSVSLPDCTDGEIFLTNYGSAFTTDREAEAGDREDETDWQLGLNRQEIGSSDDLYASVIILDDEKLIFAGDSDDNPNSRDDFVASNYILEGYDQVIVTVIDEDRNSTTSEATPVTGPVNTTINLTRRYDIEPIFVSDENNTDLVDAGDFVLADFETFDSSGDPIPANQNPNITFLITVGQAHDANNDLVSSVFLEFRCNENCDNVATVDALIGWERARYNWLEVTVDSAGGEEFNFTLWESNPDSGIFEGVLKLIYDTATDEPDNLESSLIGAIANPMNIDTLGPNHVNTALVFVDDGDSIDVTYSDQTSDDSTNTDVDPSLDDRRETVEVDAAAPTAEITRPEENDIADDNDQPTFEGTFTDDESGLLQDEIGFAINLIANVMGVPNAVNALNQAPILGSTASRTGFDTADDRLAWSGSGVGDYPSGVSFPSQTTRGDTIFVQSEDEIVDDDDFPDFNDGDDSVGFFVDDDVYNDRNFSNYVNYQAYGVDVAGNVGLSDAEESDSNVEEVFNPHSLLIDSDDITEEEIGDAPAFTGRAWDASNTQFEPNVRNSVQLVFPQRLNPDTVQPEDFRYISSEGVSLTVERVTTVSPDDVEGEDLDGDGDTDSDDQEMESEVVRYVFLELDGDIPSGDEPRVRIVGDLRDRAGNPVEDDSEFVLEDRLAPEVQWVLFSGGSGLDDEDNTRSVELTNDDITITVGVDEDLATRRVEIEFYQEIGDTGVFMRRDTSRPRKISAQGDTFRYRSDYSVSGSTGPGDVYVVIVVQDGESNRSVYGAGSMVVSDVVQVDTNNIDSDSDSQSFEFDNVDPALDNDDDGRVGAADTSDSDDSTTSDQGATLVIRFNEEVFEVLTAEVDIAGQSDSLDIKDALRQSADGEVWIYVLPAGNEWLLGEHEVTVTAIDFADNESDDLSFTFEVTEREDFTLSLSSGWNGVSFPSDPSDSSLSAVFGNSDVSQVLTYEPWSRNPWKTARRSGSGFSGDLTEIRAGVGYWVLTSSFGDLTVRLDSASDTTSAGIASTPSTIRTFPGWNFIGVLDPTFASVEGESGDDLQLPSGADYLLRTYLAGNTIGRVYEYDAIRQEFETRDITISNTDPANGPTASVTDVGFAYWVFISGDPSNPITP